MHSSAIRTRFCQGDCIAPGPLPTEAGHSVDISKRRVPLVRQIDLLQRLVQFNTRQIFTRLGGFHVSLAILPGADEPPRTDRNGEQDPGHDGADDSVEVAWRLRPQLRSADAACAVADKEEGVDYGALGVAFDVGSTETEQDRHDGCDAGGL